MTRLFLVAAAAAYCAAQETADESAPLSPISPGQRVAPGGQMSTDGRISRLEAALAALQGEVAVKVPALRQELDGCVYNRCACTCVQACPRYALFAIGRPSSNVALHTYGRTVCAHIFTPCSAPCRRAGVSFVVRSSQCTHCA